MEQIFGEVIKYGSFFSFIIAALAFTWKIVSSTITKNEAAKNRILDKEYKDKVLLQEKNAELQKEVESGRKRYVQSMIDGVNENISKLDKKFTEVHKSFMELSKTQAVNEERYQNILSQCENYFKLTETNIKIMERKLNGSTKDNEQILKEVESFKTRLHKINEDLMMVKSIADVVKKKGNH